MHLGSLMATLVSIDHNHPPGAPMTLGNVRELGRSSRRSRNLIAFDKAQECIFLFVEVLHGDTKQKKSSSV
jgi:hypothetical protein